MPRAFLRVLPVAAAVLFFILPISTIHAWTPNGAPVGPADSTQLHPAIAPDGSGGTFVVWADGRGGNNTRTVVQRLQSGGDVAPGWPTEGRLLASGGYRDHPVVISDGSGGAYIADDGTATFGIGGFGRTLAYHIGDTGSPAGGAPPGGNTITGEGSGIPGGEHGDYLPALALDAAGGAYFAWTFRDRFSQRVKVVRLLPNVVNAAGWPGNGIYALQALYTRGQEPVACAADGAGGVFVVFSNYREYDMTVVRFAADGSVTAGWPAPVSSHTEGLTAPGIVPDGSGGAFVAWQDEPAGSFARTYAQHLDAAGVVAPGWPVDGLVLSPFPTEAGIARPTNFDAATLGLSSIVSDVAGGAFVAWTDHRSGNADVYLQHLVADGIAASWPADGLALSVAAGDQSLPTLAPDGSGGAFVAWEDRRFGEADVFAQHVLPDGGLAHDWPADGLGVCIASGDQLAPVISPQGVVAWTDHRVEPAKIYAGLASPGCPLTPMSFDFSPNTLNLRSRGQWVTVTLEPEPPASPADIDIASIRLNGSVPVDASAPSSIGDVDLDGRPDLTVKFNRVALELTVPDGNAVPVTVSGRIGNGCFEEIALIRVIHVHVTAPSAGSVVQGGSAAEVRWDTPAGIQVQSVAVLSSSDDGSTWNLVAHELPNTGSYLWSVPGTATDQARIAVVLVESADQSGYEVVGVLGVSDRFAIAPLLTVGGTSIGLSLLGSVPNPNSDLSVSFTLPGAEPATLVVYDVSGREVNRGAVGALGAGRHMVTLGASGAVAPGIYVVHLIRGDRRLVARMVVVR